MNSDNFNLIYVNLVQNFDQVNLLPLSTKGQYIIINYLVLLVIKLKFFFTFINAVKFVG